MSTRNFHEMLKAKWAEGKFVCVGLDPVLDKLPQSLRKRANDAGLPGHSTGRDAFVIFCVAIINATKNYVCAYKPNSAFFEALGPHEGMGAIHEVIGIAHKIAPNVPIIYDAKRADIGNTNNGYVKSAFDCSMPTPLRSIRISAGRRFSHSWTGRKRDHRALQDFQ